MKKSRILMIIGALLPLVLFVLPMWNVALEAPQYPDSIGMDIYITKIADEEPNDLKNMNLMNHYVGMKEIPEHIPEFALFPFVVIGIILLGLIIGLIGKHKLYLLWFIVVSLVGIAGMYDFYLWEYDYGHNLNEAAAIKFKDATGEAMAYQPPLIGSKKILNFVAHSYPRSGAYFLFLGMLLSLIAFYLGIKEKRA